MTTQPTYIYSDAECVLHWMKDYPDAGRFDFNQMVEQAKSTAVKFADQSAANVILITQLGFGESAKPDTIYTVEGYNILTYNESCPEIDCCHKLGGCSKANRVATLKRIDEPVVEQQESDGWDKVYDHYKRDLEKYGSLDGGYSEWLKIKYHAPKPINPPKQ